MKLPLLLLLLCFISATDSSTDPPGPPGNLVMWGRPGCTRLGTNNLNICGITEPWRSRFVEELLLLISLLPTLLCVVVYGIAMWVIVGRAVRCIRASSKLLDEGRIRLDSIRVLGCLTICQHTKATQKGSFVCSIVLAPLAVILYDILDVFLDSWYFFELESGNLIDGSITHTDTANIAILVFAYLGAIKSILIAYCLIRCADALIGLIYEEGKLDGIVENDKEPMIDGTTKYQWTSSQQSLDDNTCETDLDKKTRTLEVGIQSPRLDEEKRQQQPQQQPNGAGAVLRGPINYTQDLSSEVVLKPLIALLVILLQEGAEQILEYHFVEKYVTGPSLLILVNVTVMGVGGVWVILGKLCGVTTVSKAPVSSRVLYIGLSVVVPVIFAVSQIARALSTWSMLLAGQMRSQCLELRGGRLQMDALNHQCLVPVDWVILLLTLLAIVGAIVLVLVNACFTCCARLRENKKKPQAMNIVV